jgi:hypothetical protein
MNRSLRLTVHRLDSAARDLLDKELTGLVAVSELDSDADEAILAGIGAYTLSRHLPAEILDAVRRFPSSGDHALLLENLPGRDFPDTPVAGFAAETELAAVNALHLGLIQLLGAVPFAVPYENSGRLIRNVVPNPDAAGTTSSWGADSEFSWHTDNPHLPFGGRGLNPRPYVPRYLTFYAVRNEERVPTELTALADATAKLDADSRRTLRSPQFCVGAPASNDAAEAGGSQRDWVPLVESGEDGDWVRFDRGTTVALTARADAALTAFRAALEAPAAVAPVLTPGSFFVFDNYRVLHRRRAFTPARPTRARWLRRCYAS